MASKPNSRPSSNLGLLFPKFKCNWPNCSFTAKRMALLKNHMRNHSQEKPFKCHYCSYSTQSRSNCKVHEQRMHTFQRPHKCHYCAYSCVQSTTLRQHVQIKHKERCQYRCFQCRNFHCQRESQLMFHLLKVHQKTSLTEISPYLNPNFLPDHMFPVATLPTMSGYAANQPVLAVDNSAATQSEVLATQNRPRHYKRHNSAPQVNPTPCKLVRATTSFSSVSNTVMPTAMPSSSQAFLSQTTANTTARMWKPSGKEGRTPFRREQQTRPVSLSDLSEHSLLSSSSLISPLDDAQEIIEITENDDEGRMSAERLDSHHERQNDGGIYICNHCFSTFTDEEGFMSHVLTNHPDAGALEQGASIKDSTQQQEATHQDVISSSSGLAFTYPTNQSSVMETSPVPMAISQNDFTAPAEVKQEDAPGSHLGQNWVSASHSESFSSDAITESVYPIVEIQQSTSTASHDSSLGHATSARVDTPLLSMPSPTTTHSNKATVSTQTTPSSADRGGCTPNQAKFCCAHCNIVFPDNVLFTIHRGAHGFHSPFECNFCGKDCINKYEFASHLHNCS